MNQAGAHRPNPLVRLARSLPAGSGASLSLAGRIGGSALALVIAFDQGYDRTRAFAVVVAVVGLLSLLPARSLLRRHLPWLGAGVLFFGGALLADLAAGKLLLLAGALAAAGVAIDEQQGRRRTAVPTFFMGFGLVCLAVIAIVLGIGG